VPPAQNVIAILSDGAAGECRYEAGEPALQSPELTLGKNLERQIREDKL
jgi:hypothetical protein